MGGLKSWQIYEFARWAFFNFCIFAFTKTVLSLFDESGLLQSWGIQSPCGWRIEGPKCRLGDNRYKSLVLNLNDNVLWDRFMISTSENETKDENSFSSLKIFTCKPSSVIKICLCTIYDICICDCITTHATVLNLSCWYAKSLNWQQTQFVSFQWIWFRVAMSRPQGDNQ